MDDGSGVLTSGTNSRPTWHVFYISHKLFIYISNAHAMLWIDQRDKYHFYIKVMVHYIVFLSIRLCDAELHDDNVYITYLLTRNL